MKIESIFRLIAGPACSAFVSFLMLTFPAKAQDATGSEADSVNDFGFLSQYNSGITDTNTNNIQSQACMPTSFINGLTYLYNYNGNTYDDYSIFNHNPDTYTDINDIALNMQTANNPTLNSYGTSYFNGVAGAGLYLSNDATYGFNSAPSVTIAGQYGFNSMGSGLSAPNFTLAAPTGTYIANALNAHDAVELWLWWGTYNPTNQSFNPPMNGGSHIVDIYSLSLVNGTGTAGIIVPESANGTLNDQNATAQVLPATVQSVMIDGTSYLYLTYSDTVPISGTPGETNEPNDLNPNAPTDQAAAIGTPQTYTALIAADFVEGLVQTPEPPTYLLLGMSLVLLAVIRRWSARA